MKYENINFLRSYIKNSGLANIPSNPFDCSSRAICRGDANLLVVGTNGNLSDSKMTNAQWLEYLDENPDFSNLYDGNYGGGHLQGRLKSIPAIFNNALPGSDFSSDRTIYTNLILLCSKDVNSIKSECNNQGVDEKSLISKSLKFFIEATLSVCDPRFIFCFGNAESGYSPYAILKNFFPIEDFHFLHFKCRNLIIKISKVNIKGINRNFIFWPHPSYNPIYPEGVVEAIQRFDDF